MIFERRYTTQRERDKEKEKERFFFPSSKERERERETTPKSNIHTHRESSTTKQQHKRKLNRKLPKKKSRFRQPSKILKSIQSIKIHSEKVQPTIFFGERERESRENE